MGAVQSATQAVARSDNHNKDLGTTSHTPFCDIGTGHHYFLLCLFNTGSLVCEHIYPSHPPGLHDSKLVLQYM